MVTDPDPTKPTAQDYSAASGPRDEHIRRYAELLEERRAENPKPQNAAMESRRKMLNNLPAPFANHYVQRMTDADSDEPAYFEELARKARLEAAAAVEPRWLPFGSKRWQSGTSVQPGDFE